MNHQGKIESNVDLAEVAKFDAIASRWWDKNGEFKPLHDINPLRLGYIEQHCNGLANKKVLDVGCGGGILSESMAAKHAHVTGVDMAEQALSVAKLHLFESGLNVDYQHNTAEQLAEQQPGKFDVVTCMELLEHVPNPASLIKACAALAKPDGDIFFSTINRHPKAYLMAIIGAEYVLNILPHGTHDYEKFIRPSEMGAWIRQADMEICDLIGMQYNPLTRQYSLGKNMDVNYLVHVRKVAS